MQLQAALTKARARASIRAPNPRERPGTQVVLRVDESSYSGGKMGPDHPIAWAREIDRGRAYYTAFGHPPEAWDDPLLVRHVEAAIRWAARRP